MIPFQNHSRQFFRQFFNLAVRTPLDQDNLTACISQYHVSGYVLHYTGDIIFNLLDQLLSICRGNIFLQLSNADYHHTPRKADINSQGIAPLRQSLRFEQTVSQNPVLQKTAHNSGLQTFLILFRILTNQNFNHLLHNSSVILYLLITAGNSDHSNTFSHVNNRQI